MPRGSRKASVSGIYHVMSRGIDKRDIFITKNDFLKFISLMEKCQQKTSFKLYAYCLMHNHFHLLINPMRQELGKCMQLLTTSYALYHNACHQRFGHLFQNRFKSETIENDDHFLTVLRYIHQNPVKAGLVSEVKNYDWTSFHEYNEAKTTVDVDFAINMAGNKDELLKLLSMPVDSVCLDVEIVCTLNEDELRQAISSIITLDEFEELSPLQRDDFIRAIKEKTHASNRKLAVVMGVSSSLIDRALKRS
jgi:putative transposase